LRQAEEKEKEDKITKRIKLMEATEEDRKRKQDFK